MQTQPFFPECILMLIFCHAKANLVSDIRDIFFKQRIDSWLKSHPLKKPSLHSVCVILLRAGVIGWSV